jgi:hypothetical protein
MIISVYFKEYATSFELRAVEFSNAIICFLVLNMLIIFQQKIDSFYNLVYMIEDFIQLFFSDGIDNEINKEYLYLFLGFKPQI